MLSLFTLQSVTHYSPIWMRCVFLSRGFGDRHRVPLQSCPSASQGFPHYRQNWRRYALLATLSTTLEFIYCLFQTNTAVTRSLEQKRCSCRAVYLCIRYVQLGVSGWGSDAGWEERDVCPETPHPNQPPYTHRRWASVSHCRWVSPVLLFMSHLQIHLDSASCIIYNVVPFLKLLLYFVVLTIHSVCVAVREFHTYARDELQC